MAIEHEIMWFPGVYVGRQTPVYIQFVKDLPLEEIISLVQDRVSEDGEWLIANGMVGENNQNEPKMRAMMAFSSEVKHIKQAVEYIYAEGSQSYRTVDYVCRELADASKWAVSVKK